MGIIPNIVYYSGVNCLVVFPTHLKFSFNITSNFTPIHVYPGLKVLQCDFEISPVRHCFFHTMISFHIFISMPKIRHVNLFISCEASFTSDTHERLFFNRKPAVLLRAQNNMAASALENTTDRLEIDGLVLRIDYLIRTLVNVENHPQTDEITRLFGEASNKLTREAQSDLALLVSWFQKVFIPP